MLYPAELRALFIAIGVITEFKTLLVSKGPKRVRFELHHYRLAQVKANVIILGGSGLVIFVFQGLIFLCKTAQSFVTQRECLTTETRMRHLTASLSKDFAKLGTAGGVVFQLAEPSVKMS
ncbi:MAG TPA: hypothetical protein VNY07_12340 [Chthoniobacterales bacterium]|nr:hypothetical protein [Chthoniobacterales bacterium]